jgi:hypothetical protein
VDTCTEFYPNGKENVQNPNIIACASLNKVMRSVGHASRMEERRDSYSVLVGKPEGKTTLGRPTRTREDNIRTHLEEIRWGQGLG